MYRAAHTARKNIHFSSSGAGRHSRGASSQERTRLRQLLVCVVLFLTVFVGKGIFPAKLLQVRDDIVQLITYNIDFKAAFSKLGAAIGGEGTLLDQFGEFCVEVFGGPSGPDADPQQVGNLRGSPQSKIVLLTGGRQDPEELTQHLFSSDLPKLDISFDPEPAQQSEQTAKAEEPAAVPAAGTLLLKSDYNGQELPNNYTMDKLSLGDLETVTPVLGHLNSVYGYRDHPINGVYQFHGGVDIGGQTGDPISAFAAGTVEYVGQDDSYGLYLQLDHGNGVKSFYAHCNKVCVTKGQAVSMWEKIAEVGSSGAATGPHLHLELKFNKTHLDPIYYIQVLEN